MSSPIAVAIAGLSACAVTSAGIYTISRFEEAARKYSVYFVSFGETCMNQNGIRRLASSSSNWAFFCF